MTRARWFVAGLAVGYGYALTLSILDFLRHRPSVASRLDRRIGHLVPTAPVWIGEAPRSLRRHRPS